MKINKLLYTLIAGLLLAVSSCSPDDYSLGSKDVTPDDLAEGIAYTIEHDADNPNIVYLHSKLGTNYTSLWTHPQGLSQAHDVTLKIAFPGTYDVVYGVQTRGGVVYGDTAHFTIDSFCSDFVSDPMWTMLTGGVGKSKKWFCDLDANGKSRYFYGPVYFKGTDDCWETITEGKSSPYGSDSWAWDADWSGVAGWQWSATAMDFGYMEFDLNGGSNVHVVMNDLGKDITGSFMLDLDKHIISFSGAELLHESVNDGVVQAWNGELRLLSLTDNTMQIAVVRKTDPCILCLNFISEDYFNSWDPNSGVSSDVTPSLVEGWKEYIEPNTKWVNTYVLDTDQPFDYCTLEGGNKNVSLYSPAEGIEDVKLVLNHNKHEFEFTDKDGKTTKGQYTLSDDGIMEFLTPIPASSLSSDDVVQFKLNAANQLRVLQVAASDYDNSLTDLWLGCGETTDQGQLYQYVGYHFVPQTTGETVKHYTANLNFSDTGWAFINGENVDITTEGDYTFTITPDGACNTQDPYLMYLDVLKILKDHPNADLVVKSLKVDGNELISEITDDMIIRCLGDDATTGRRYILNPWNEESVLHTNSFKFSSSIEVVITVKFDVGEVVLQ